MVKLDIGAILRIQPRVHYSGQPYYKWTKDNGPLPENTQQIGYELHVPYVTKENEGTYTLTLTDLYGTAKIQVNVIVQDTRTTTRDPRLPKKIVVSHNDVIELEEDQNANIICRLRPRNPSVRPFHKNVQFYFDFKFNMFGLKILHTTSWFKGNGVQKERFPTNIRPNQEMMKIIKAHPKNSGQYTCTLSSIDGTHESIIVSLYVKRNFFLYLFRIPF